MKNFKPRKVRLAGLVFLDVKHFFAILLLSAAPLACAMPESKTLEWKPACDGASITVTSEGKRLQKISASAYHSLIIVEWEIEFGDDGQPSKVQHRELRRGRIEEGEDSGAYSGIDKLTRSHTWQQEKGKLEIGDKELRAEFDDILRRAKGAEEAGEPVR